MSLRRVTMAAALVCGLCVWGFAGSDEGSGADAGPESARADDGNRDEAEARYRASQSRHWRHVAIGSGTAAR